MIKNIQFLKEKKRRKSVNVSFQPTLYKFNIHDFSCNCLNSLLRAILNWIGFFHSSSNYGAFGPFSGGFLNIASNGCVVQAPRRPIRSKRENGRKIALNQSWVTQSICRKNLLFAHNYNLNQNIVDAGIGKFKRNIFEKLLRNFSNFNLTCKSFTNYLFR